MMPPHLLAALALSAGAPGAASIVDHVVVWTPDLTEGDRLAGALFGVRPMVGGSHPGRGTRNHLLSLGPGTYLELLGPDPVQPAPRQRPGTEQLDVATFVVADRNLEHVAAAARAAGLEPIGPRDGSRTRPDGSVVRWRSLELGGHGFGGLMPSFVTWLTPEHPSGSAPVAGRLARLTALHPRADELARLFAALGVPVECATATSPGFVLELEGARGRTILLGRAEGY